MTWLIKRGGYEYVFANTTEWTDDQRLAHRFDDGNHAANVLGNMPALDTDDARIVRLVKRGGS